MPRGFPLMIALATLLGVGGQAVAQVAPPRLVEDDDPEEPAKPPPAAVPQPGPSGEVTPPPTGPAPGPGTPAPSGPAAGSAIGPVLGPPALPAAEPARKITPVQTSWAKLMEHWAARRKALREGDPAGAEAAQKLLLADQRELAIEN